MKETDQAEDKKEIVELLAETDDILKSNETQEMRRLKQLKKWKKRKKLIRNKMAMKIWIFVMILIM